MLLWLFLALAVAASLVSSADRALPSGARWSWGSVVFWLILVSVGGRISRVVLLGVVGSAYAATSLSLARTWAPWLMLPVYAAMIAILVSPAVYARTRRKGGRGLVTYQTAWPSRWMLLAAPVAGLAVMPLFLGDVHFVATAGCNDCLVRGYPLGWLVQYRAVKIAPFLRDWAQWSVVALSASYVVWLWYRRPFLDVLNGAA
jgi:hypothetical protein